MEYTAQEILSACTKQGVHSDLAEIELWLDSGWEQKDDADDSWVF